MQVTTEPKRGEFHTVEIDWPAMAITGQSFKIDGKEIDITDFKVEGGMTGPAKVTISFFASVRGRVDAVTVGAK